MAREPSIGKALRKLAEASVNLATADLDKLADIDATADEIDKLDGAGAVVASGTAQDHEADVTITTDLTNVDTGTDMTAAQAGQIETDLANLAAAVNTILASLEAFGIHASS